MSRKRRHRLQRKRVVSEQKAVSPRVESAPRIEPGTLPELQQIPADLVDRCWPLCVGLIAAALRGQEYSPEQMRQLCADGDNQLWFAWNDPERKLEAAAVTGIIDTPDGAVCVIVACGGRDRSRWLGLLDQIEQWAKQQGCKTMRLYGRKGWTRVLSDYRVTRFIMDKEL